MPEIGPNRPILSGFELPSSPLSQVSELRPGHPASSWKTRLGWMRCFHFLLNAEIVVSHPGEKNPPRRIARMGRPPIEECSSSKMSAFQKCSSFEIPVFEIRRTLPDFYIAFMSTVYNCCIRGNRHGDQTRQATQDSQRSAMGCDGSHGKRSLLGVYGCLEHGEPLQCFRVLGSRKSPFLSGGDLGCSSSHLTVRDWSCYR